MKGKESINVCRLYEVLARIMAAREGCRVSVTVTAHPVARSA